MPQTSAKILIDYLIKSSQPPNKVGAITFLGLQSFWSEPGLAQSQGLCSFPLLLPT